jgi:hypothetical protein
MAIEPDYTAQGGVWSKSHHCWEWRDEHGHRLRVDGPAVIWADGRQGWWQRGELHRGDGPAVIRTDGSEWWFVQGYNITNEVLDWMRANTIALPFTTEQQVEFALRWL